MFACPVEMITKVSSRWLHYLNWCTTEVHQHGGSILGSVICAKHFDKYLKFGITHRPKTWRSVSFIYLLKHQIFLTSSTKWFSIYFFVAWQWKRSIEMLVMKNKASFWYLVKDLHFLRESIFLTLSHAWGICTVLTAPPWGFCMLQLPRGGAFATLWKQNVKCLSNARGGDERAWKWQSHYRNYSI